MTAKVAFGHAGDDYMNAEQSPSRSCCKTVNHERIEQNRIAESLTPGRPG